MKTLTLDLKKWRCGGNKENKLGEGCTNLLNEEGFMCCLGQFSIQQGAETRQIVNKITPATAHLYSIPAFVQANGHSTELSHSAMKINDNEDLTTEQRIAALKELFSKHGFEIKVINQ